MSERYYVNSPLAPGPLLLQGPEAHHLATVCRLQPGGQVYLFNGDGKQYRAEITHCDRRQVALDVNAAETPARELPFQLEVACPLPKGDRGQFLIEKLTELGVTRYVPLRTRRSVVHPGETKVEKLHRYVIEAAKQCGRNILMEIAPICDWESYAQQEGLVQKCLAHRGDVPFLPPELGQDTRIAVGPEGGFTTEEVAMAQAAGWQLVNLGPRTLRVETAAIVMAGACGCFLRSST